MPDKVCDKVAKVPRQTPTKSLTLLLAAGLAFLCTLLTTACRPNASEPAHQKPKPDVAFKPQEMTDALHGVIAANRAVYAREVVQRLHDAKVLESTENWRQTDALPLHADMLRMTAQAVQQPGAEFHFILRSLSPINPRNGPQTDIEKKGLEAVAEHPEKNFYSEEFLGGRRYFTAAYADRALVQTCVECHNAHPASPRKDYKPGDIMGALIIRVPLEF